MIGAFNIITAISLTIISIMGLNYLNITFENKINLLLGLAIFNIIWSIIETIRIREELTESKIYNAYKQGRNKND